jgi:hypothetical protein
MVAEVLVKRNNVFAIVSPQRTYYLQAQSRKDMEEWIACLKLVLSELHMNDPAVESHLQTAPNPTVLMDQFMDTVKIRSRSLSPSKSNLSRIPSLKETLSLPTDQPTSLAMSRATSAPEVDLNAFTASPPQSPSSPISELQFPQATPFQLDSSDSDSDDEEGTTHKRNRSKHEAEDHFAVVGGTNNGLVEEENNIVVWQGYLEKVGKAGINWKRRWFVLKNGRLYVYDSEKVCVDFQGANFKDTQPNKIIPLTDVLSIFPKPPFAERGAGEGPWQPVQVSKSHPYCFRVVLPKRTVTMAAASEQDLLDVTSAMYSIQQRVLERRAVKNRQTAQLPPAPVVPGYAEGDVQPLISNLSKLEIQSRPAGREGEVLVEFVAP